MAKAAAKPVARATMTGATTGGAGERAHPAHIPGFGAIVKAEVGPLTEFLSRTPSAGHISSPWTKSPVAEMGGASPSAALLVG
jgi:hypothetical protein